MEHHLQNALGWAPRKINKIKQDVTKLSHKLHPQGQPHKHHAAHPQIVSALGEDCTLHCSTAYSMESILLAATEIKQDPGFDRICFQDLITQGEASKWRAVQELIVSTMPLPPGTPTKGFRRGRHRKWKLIEFVDCVKSKDAYAEYKEKKKSFKASLKRYYQETTSHGVLMDLPFSYGAKVEVHPPMELFTAIHLFRQIAHDDSVDHQVEFTNVSMEVQKHDTLAQALCSSFDKKTLRWMGRNVDMFVYFLDEDGESSHSLRIQSFHKVMEKEEDEKEEPNYNRRHNRRIYVTTKDVLRGCARKLETLAYSTSDTSALSSAGSLQTPSIEEGQEEE